MTDTFRHELLGGHRRRSRRGRFGTPALFLCVVAITIEGCAKYVPLPLSGDAVERVLAMPSREVLRTQIVALHNPLIRTSDVDPSAELTPDDAAVIAAVANPNVRAQRSRPGVATARLLDAGILPDPTLNFALDVPFGSNSRGEARGYGLSLEWEVTALIARGAKLDAARAAAQQVRLDVAWSEWQAAQAARQAAFDVVALREQRVEAEGLHEQLGRIADQSQRALASHDVTAADAAAARAAEQDSAVAVAGIARDQTDAELALNRALGFPPTAAVRVDPRTSLPTTLPVDDAATLTRNVESRRFDLVALRRGYDSQEASVRAAVLGQFPRLALGISNTRDFSDFLTLGPSVSVDVPLFNRNRGVIAIERATRRQLYDEYIARVFEARADIAQAVARIRTLNDVVAAQAAQVRSLRALVANDELALTRGNVDVATFYAVAVSLAQKQNDLTKLKQDLIHARIALELAAGARLDAPRASPAAPEVAR